MLLTLNKPLRGRHKALSHFVAGNNDNNHLGKGGVADCDVEGSILAQKAGGAADFVCRRQDAIAFGVAQREVAAAAVPRQLSVDPIFRRTQNI